MLLEVPLHCSPKELNKVELTVIFGEHNAEMTGSFNCLMHERLLFLKIWLQIQNVFGTTISCIRIAIWFLALHLQFGSEKTSFSENLLHSLGLIWESWMICGKDHVLHNLFPRSIDKPLISKSWLRSCRVKVHVSGQQCIRSINAMTL